MVIKILDHMILQWKTDENGEEKITYQERPVGVIKKDYTIEYDKEAGVKQSCNSGIPLGRILSGRN